MPHPDTLPPEPHPDPELLVLAALPAEPADPAVTAHLHGCARCRAEVAVMRHTVELARTDGDSLTPGIGVGEPLPPPPPQVWLRIAAELGLAADRNGQVDRPVAGAVDDRVTDMDGPEEPSDGSHGDPGRIEDERWPARRPRRRRIAVLVAAAVLGAVVGLGTGRALAPAPPPAPVAGPAAPLAPVGSLDPGASGTVAMADERGAREMVVQVRGVTNLAGGDHLEAWLMDPSGTRLVPLGPLDGGSGDFHGTFAVPPGLPLGEFDRVDVSAEHWDGNPGHSSLSVLRGTL